MDLITLAAAKKLAGSGGGAGGTEQKTSQNVLYKFSFDELKNKKAPNTGEDIISHKIGKTIISSKGGVPCEIFAINWNIMLWLGSINLQSKELTKYFDVPIKTDKVEGTLSNASITNIVSFSPFLIIPSLRLGPLTIKEFCWDLSSYITSYDYRLFSDAMQHDNLTKTVGIELKIIFEFANETIRNAFYNEFSGMLNEITHFCLMYQDSDTIDCEYIGG